MAKNTKETTPRRQGARACLKVIRIYLYPDDNEGVSAVVSGKTEERKVRDTIKEFVRLDRIYLTFNSKNPRYAKAVEIIEAGFTAFLNSKGITTPEVKVMSL